MHIAYVIKDKHYEYTYSAVQLKKIEYHKKQKKKRKKTKQHKNKQNKLLKSHQG